MSQVTTESGWMTSFIYQQDLTSYYMNNVLSGVFRPGVYNANIAIVFESDRVFLSIKKGTTLLFSNNYIDCDEYGVRRNFSETSNLEFHNLDSSQSEAEDIVLIKCVAQYDIFQEIYDLSNGELFDPSSDAPGKELYVYAYMKYNKSSLSTETIPNFRLACKNNTTRRTSDQNLQNDFMYKTIDSDSYSITSETAYSFPDGCTNYDYQNISKKLKDYSFLMIGVLACTGDYTKSVAYNYITFTGRGLPEYRYSMLSENGIMSPSFIMNCRTVDDTLCKYGYLDIPNTLISDILYNQRIVDGDYEDLSWEQFYDNNCHIIDSLSESDFNKIDFNISSEDLQDNNKGIILDFIFGKVNSVEVESDIINFSESKSSISLEKETLIHPISEDSNFNNFDYYKDDYWFTKKDSLSIDNYHVVPLDICERNITRLSKLIQNKNLWEQVISKYRRKNNIDNNDTIIPIAIAFRPFSVNEVDLPAETDGIYFTSYIDTLTTVNSINVLSYFDLVNRKSKANVLNINTSNIYNQIPIR